MGGLFGEGLGVGGGVSVPRQRVLSPHAAPASMARFVCNMLPPEGRGGCARVQDIDLCSYDIRVEGAAPVHATHLPLESPSSW